MQTFDTNVVVRIILGDDPKQAAAAATHWRQALASFAERTLLFRELQSARVLRWKIS